VFDRVAALIWSLSKPRAKSRTAGITPDFWRFDPGNLDDLWSRSAIVHFPADEAPARRFVASRYPDHAATGQPSGSGRTGEFRGFRAFEPGDDPRDVDWRATARARQAIVRERSRESTQPITIVADVSASMWVDRTQGRVRLRPIDMAFEAVVWLAAAALAKQVPLDLILVSDHVEWRLSRLRGRQSIRQIVSKLQAFRPINSGTDWLTDLLGRKAVAPGSLVFWVSDFEWLPDPREFRQSFGHVRSMGFRIQTDVSGDTTRDEGLLQDSESGTLVDPSMVLSPAERTQRVHRWADEASVPVLDLSIDTPRPELLIAEWLAGSRFGRRGG
jgi:uncharacterized protein (DUF58 family)